MWLFPGSNPGLVSRIQMCLVPGLPWVHLMSPAGRLWGWGGVVPCGVSSHHHPRRHYAFLKRRFWFVLRIFKLFNFLLLFLLLFALSVPNQTHGCYDPWHGDTYCGNFSLVGTVALDHHGPGHHQGLLAWLHHNHAPLSLNFPIMQNLCFTTTKHTKHASDPYQTLAHTFCWRSANICQKARKWLRPLLPPTQVPIPTAALLLDTFAVLGVSASGTGLTTHNNHLSLLDSFAREQMQKSWTAVYINYLQTFLIQPKDF